MSRKTAPATEPETVEHPDPVLAAFLQKIPEAYSVSIRKQVQGKYRFVRTVQPDAIGPILEDFLQRNFGGGVYQIILNDSSGHIITVRASIEIEELPEQERSKQPAVHEEESTAVVKRGGTFNDVIEMMREENNRMHQLMIEMIRSRSDAGSGGSVTELVTALAQLKRLEPPPPPAPPAMDEIFLKGIEFARRAEGGGGSNDSLMGIFREVITIARPLVEKAMAGATATPGATPAAGAVPQQTAPGGEPEEEQVDIEPALNYVKAKFRQGTSINTIAEIIIDQTQGNPDYTDMVLHVANLPVEEFLSLDDEFLADPMKTPATNLHAELRRRLIPAIPTK